MKRSLNDLVGYTVSASDGVIGNVSEFYFDDHTWTIRYLVVDIGNWIIGRKVLISPLTLNSPDWESRTFPVNLTKEQIKNSPNTDSDKPISRQHVAALHGYYNWPLYQGSLAMTSGGSIGFGGVPAMSAQSMPVVSGEMDEPEDPEGDLHLRSSSAVTGYGIHALDGEIGHVKDFMVDDETWAIRYLLVDTSNWLPDKLVLMSPQWIREISWNDSKVFVEMTRDAIKNSPEFDPSKPLCEKYECELHDYYGRPLK